jgi:glycosyltransferase involved in cell wall biosynthesis
MWKSLPPGVRAEAHKSFDATLRFVAPARRRWHWQRDLAPRPPIAVAGLHRAVLGIGQGARLFHSAFRQIGLDAFALDLTGDFALDEVLDDPGPLPPEGGILFSHLNPPELLYWLRRRGMRALKSRRHIGYWAWETQTPPPSWAEAFAYVDEIWCPSRFTAQAIARLPGERPPVHIVPHPVFATEGLTPRRPRADGPVNVLVAFDMRSTAARKNPWAAIQAFTAADRPEAVLNLKVAAGEADRAALTRLRALASGSNGRIRLIEADLGAADMAALIVSSDIVMNLHRSEGFGLLIAEAMLAAKPVITVDWSGPADFLTPQAAALVPFDLVQAGPEAGPYAGALWAEADVAEAGRILGHLIDDAPSREALGTAGAHVINGWCGPEAWAGRIREHFDLTQAAD